MGKTYPVADVGGSYAEDVSQNVDLEFVEVTVNAGAQQSLELVRAGLDLVLGRLGRV